MSFSGNRTGKSGRSCSRSRVWKSNDNNVFRSVDGDSPSPVSFFSPVAWAIHFYFADMINGAEGLRSVDSKDAGRKADPKRQNNNSGYRSSGPRARTVTRKSWISLGGGERGRQGEFTIRGWCTAHTSVPFAKTCIQARILPRMHDEYMPGFIGFYSLFGTDAYCCTRFTRRMNQTGGGRKMIVSGRQEKRIAAGDRHRGLIYGPSLP